MNKTIKILLIGNSYTYYNGLGQLISRFCGATNRDVIVVRATKGATPLKSLLTTTLSFKSWKNGKTVSKGESKLDTILARDFGKLNRANKWDYIVVQNNTTLRDTYSGDRAAFDKLKKFVPKADHFIINCTHFGGSVATDRLVQHKKLANEVGCSIIDTRKYFKFYSKVFKNRDWKEDLTIMDDSYHASARGMYIIALAIFGKIFGVADMANSPKAKKFIKVYSSKKYDASSIITDHYKKHSNIGAKITKSIAKKAQYFVRLYAEDCLGTTKGLEK